MEVRKLYYEDSHKKSFSARVTACNQEAEHWAVLLDATAFYPLGGGQPWDTGVLGDSRVLSVREEGEQVVHLCDAPLPVGSAVIGEIDWQRRFDFMQQHSGEHIVSGVVHKLYGWHNVGFHMGAEAVTIDFDGPIPADDLPKIEATVNAAIWENLPVKCYYPTREELNALPYRRKKDLPWPVRIVEIAGIDLCACCGTQVKSTGEIGLVKLLSCVKFHEGVRIEMVCGKRALDLLNTAFDQNRQVSQILSAKQHQTGQAVQRLNDALSAEKFRSAALEKQLFAAIAQNYAGKSLAVHFGQDLSPAANRALCDAIAGVCSVAITLSGSDKAGYALCIISRTEDAKALGEEITRALQGRGGGKREAFQGNITATRQEITDFFQQSPSFQK